VEVFGGTGAVLFGKKPSPREVYNDIDGDLHNLYTVLRDRPEELAGALTLTPYSRRDFEKACEYVNHKRGPADDAVEWARQYVVCTRQRFIGGGADTWSTARKGFLPSQTWARLPEWVLPIHRRLQGVAIESLDYKDLFSKWDAEDTTFYCDPPYEGVEKVYYKANKDGGFDHQALREVLEGVKGSSVVSYYVSDYLLKLYNGFDVVTKIVTTKVGQKTKEVTEGLFIRSSAWARQRPHRYVSRDIFPEVHPVQALRDAS